MSDEFHLNTSNGIWLMIICSPIILWIIGDQLPNTKEGFWGGFFLMMKLVSVLSWLILGIIGFKSGKADTLIKKIGLCFMMAFFVFGIMITGGNRAYYLFENRKIITTDDYFLSKNLYRGKHRYYLYFNENTIYNNHYANRLQINAKTFKGLNLYQQGRVTIDYKPKAQILYHITIRE